jgi:hypothetical protein
MLQRNYSPKQPLEFEENLMGSRLTDRLYSEVGLRVKRHQEVAGDLMKPFKSIATR